MEYGLHALQRGLTVLVVGVNLCVLVACSDGNGGSVTPPAAVHTNAGTVYVTVDDPNCKGVCENEVAGINDSRDVVGNYADCTTSGDQSCNSEDWSCAATTDCQPCPLIGGAASWSSYTATYNSVNGSYSSYASVEFPDTSGQYMYAISNRPPGFGVGLNATGPTPPPTTEVGCTKAFAGGGTEEKGFWSLEDANGLWSVLNKGGDSTSCGNANAASALVGYDDTNSTTPTMIGFYDDYSDTRGTCDFEAWEIYQGGGHTKLAVKFVSSFTATDVVATGLINSNTSSKIGIVGFAKNKSASGPTLEGWYMTSSTALLTPYNFPGASATAFTGIATVNSSATPVIVGWYTKGKTTHGLWATTTASGGIGTVTSIDEPSAQGLTIVNGVNKLGDVCGWYTDSTGTYNGFVGLGVAGSLLKHPYHRLGARRITS
jgi:hypothetical protein